MDFIFDPGLALYLPLCELDGSSFISKDTYGHQCTVTGATWTPRGRNFDGLDDYINCGNANSLKNITQEVTAGLWVKAAPQNNVRLFSHYDTGANQRSWLISFGEVGTGGDDKVDVFLSDDGTFASGRGKRYRSSDTVFDTDNFHQVDFTFDRGILRLFIDGVEDTAVSKLTDNAITSLHASTVDVLISAMFNNGSVTGYSTILVPLAWVYNRALTPAEIQRNYLATKWRYQ